MSEKAESTLIVCLSELLELERERVLAEEAEIEAQQRAAIEAAHREQAQREQAQREQAQREQAQRAAEQLEAAARAAEAARAAATSVGTVEGASAHGLAEQADRQCAITDHTAELPSQAWPLVETSGEEAQDTDIEIGLPSLKHEIARHTKKLHRYYLTAITMLVLLLGISWTGTLTAYLAHFRPALSLAEEAAATQGAAAAMAKREAERVRLVLARLMQAREPATDGAVERTPDAVPTSERRQSREPRAKAPTRATRKRGSGTTQGQSSLAPNTRKTPRLLEQLDTDSTDPLSGLMDGARQ